jgi:hypothetical protein
LTDFSVNPVIHLRFKFSPKKVNFVASGQADLGSAGEQPGKEIIMKELGNKMSELIGLLLLLSVQSCWANTKNSKMKASDEFISQKIEYKDSLFILHTVKEWAKKNWYTFEDYSKMYKITNEQVEYFIGGVFYSPDKKRILALVGQKVPNAATIKIYNKENSEVNKLCPRGPDTIYILSAVIGVRENINQIWKLYPFNQKQATCFGSKEKTIDILNQYFCYEMKTDQMYGITQTGRKKGQKELQAFGYNIQDKGFWDKCWLFQKDTVGSYGLYPFQIKAYSYKGIKCDSKCAQPFNPPEITYPEEIRKLFNF